jgi:hypothetical protein
MLEQSSQTFHWPDVYVPVRPHGCRACARQVSIDAYLITADGSRACSEQCKSALEAKRRLRNDDASAMATFVERLTRSLFDTDPELVALLKLRAEVTGVVPVAALNKAWDRGVAKLAPEHAIFLRAQERAGHMTAAMKRRPLSIVFSERSP